MDLKGATMRYMNYVPLVLLVILSLVGRVVGQSQVPQPPLDQQLVDACSDDSASLETISLLLKSGADINATNQVGGTPLMLAAQTHTNPQVITILVNAGADPEQAADDGMTPLMLAATHNERPADALNTFRGRIEGRCSN